MLWQHCHIHALDTGLHWNFHVRVGMLIHKQVIYSLRHLTNTGCKLVTSLWSFNCRVHRPGWFTRKAHCTHSPLSAPLKMHLLWVTWSKQLSTAPHYTSQSQGRVTLSVAASPLCSAAASLDGPNLVWLCLALSGSVRMASPANLDFVFHKVENITFTTQNKITTLLLNKTCFNHSQMFLIKLN